MLLKSLWPREAEPHLLADSVQSVFYFIGIRFKWLNNISFLFDILNAKAGVSLEELKTLRFSFYGLLNVVNKLLGWLYPLF